MMDRRPAGFQPNPGNGATGRPTGTFRPANGGAPEGDVHQTGVWGTGP